MLLTGARDFRYRKVFGYCYRVAYMLGNLHSILLRDRGILILPGGKVTDRSLTRASDSLGLSFLPGPATAFSHATTTLGFGIEAFLDEQERHLHGRVEIEVGDCSRNAILRQCPIDREAYLYRKFIENVLPIRTEGYRDVLAHDCLYLDDSFFIGKYILFKKQSGTIFTISSRNRHLFSPIMGMRGAIVQEFEPEWCKWAVIRRKYNGRGRGASTIFAP